jgi:tyrosyl-tRNA synthetase
MDIQDKIALIKQVGEEIVGEDELSAILSSKGNFIAYDGFEPSGTNIHIAQGLLRAININKMTKAGCTFKMLVADWHAWANNKMGGNLEHIQKVGQYLIEVWKACDMDLSHVEFLWASDVVKDDNYWKIVMQVARNSTVNRILRCGQIMGRKESEVQQASQILYPCMQAADIFYLKADVCQLGMDQRKVNMLARELAQKLGFVKPVVVSHHMLMGLSKPPEKSSNVEDRVMELKMSKSKPDTAIFMTDSEEEIKRKISKAYCPEKIVEENPILEYFKYIIFEQFDHVSIQRPEKWGGNVDFVSYIELEESFSSGKLHPVDLKAASIEYINKLIEPVRKRLASSKTAQKLQEEIRSFSVTR